LATQGIPWHWVQILFTNYRCDAEMEGSEMTINSIEKSACKT